MATWPFRFIHASDLHLERVAEGIGEVPDHLRELLVDGAHRAVGRLVDAAIAEEVDFLVFSGDMLDPSATAPRELLFLADQFQRLAQRKIHVYWGSSAIDSPDAWPAWLPLPETVHVFPLGQSEEVIHYRDGEPLARLVGLGRNLHRLPNLPGNQADSAGLFTIGVFHGEHAGIDAAHLASRGLHYWALGGSHVRNTLCNSPCVAHDPGTMIGQNRQETGPRGATLVSVDEQRNVRMSLMTTDTFRWCNESIAIDEQTTRDALDKRIRERLQSLSDASPDVALLISWTVTGTGPLMAKLRAGPMSSGAMSAGTTSFGPMAGQLLAGLRADFGRAKPARWSFSLECDPAIRLPEPWYEQETFLGDYLRALRHYQVNADEPLNLKEYLGGSESPIASDFAAMIDVHDRTIRDRVLRDAAQLGADLLRGEESQP